MSLTVGVAQAAMTPPLGLWMSGYGARTHGADHVLDELAAVAAVLTKADSDQRVVLVTVDLCIPTIAWARRARQAIASAVGTTAEHVAICSSHTHCGPSFSNWDGEGEEDRAYGESLIAMLAGLASTAAAKSRWAVRPARLGFAQGQTLLGVNRRDRRSTAAADQGRRPPGPTDPSVSVLRIDDGDGRPLALLANAACHPVVLDGDFYGWSGDYVGVARRVVEAELDLPLLFLQGACADINPAKRGPDGLRATGLQLAGEALRLWASAETHEPDRLAAVATSLTLPLTDLPELDEAKRQEQEALQALARAEVAPPSRGLSLYGYRMLARAAQRVREQVERGDRHPIAEVDLQAMSLGPVTVVGAACEPFCQTGLTVKTQSPRQPVVFSGYTNGVVGYIPTAGEYQFGGYEVDTAHKYFGLPSVPDPTCEQRVVTECLSLLERLP